MPASHGHYGGLRFFWPGMFKLGLWEPSAKVRNSKRSIIFFQVVTIIEKVHCMPLPGTIRTAGLDYQLQFISEIDAKLRSLAEAVHEPKVVFEELCMQIWLGNLRHQTSSVNKFGLEIRDI